MKIECGEEGVAMVVLYWGTSMHGMGKRKVGLSLNHQI